MARRLFLQKVVRVKILLWVSLWPAEVDKHSGQGHRNKCVTSEKCQLLL